MKTTGHRLQQVQWNWFGISKCPYNVRHWFLWHSYDLANHFVWNHHPEFMNEILDRHQRVFRERFHKLYLSGDILALDQRFHSDWTLTTQWNSVRTCSSDSDYEVTNFDHWLRWCRILVTHVKIVQKSIRCVTSPTELYFLICWTLGR